MQRSCPAQSLLGKVAKNKMVVMYFSGKAIIGLNVFTILLLKNSYMHISYNKYQVYGKVTILIIFLFITACFIFLHPPLPSAIHFTFQAVFIAFIFLLLFCMLVLITMQLFFLPKSIEINTTDQTLTVHYFLLPPNIIYLNDISSYTTTKLFTRSKDHAGILVHSQRGRKYLFDDINIADYRPIKKFLDDCNISFAGNEVFNNISYFISFFKYK